MIIFRSDLFNFNQLYRDVNKEVSVKGLRNDVRYWSESGLGSESIDLEMDISYGLLSLIFVFSSVLETLYSTIEVRRGAEERWKEGL